MGDTRLRIEEKHRVVGTTIKTPGKFFGCPVWAEYFWDKRHTATTTARDEEDVEVFTFVLTESDRKEFPELNDVDSVSVFMDTSGDVHTVES